MAEWTIASALKADGPKGPGVQIPPVPPVHFTPHSMLCFLERCQRGRMGRPAKALSGFNRTVGSNPTLSAMRVRTARAIILAIFVCVLAPSSKVLAACQREYVVRPGNSWWSIAQSASATVREILKLNGAKTSTVIQPGDVVCVSKVSITTDVRYSKKEIIRIIREIWPDHLEERAIAIAQRESKLRPGVVGVPNRCCYGLFQIYYKWHKAWLPRFGITEPRQLLEPRNNAIAALEIYRRNGGWGPWE